MRRGRGGGRSHRGRDVLAVVLAVATVLAPITGAIAVPGAGVGVAAGASTLVVDGDGGGERHRRGGTARGGLIAPSRTVGA